MALTVLMSWRPSLARALFCRALLLFLSLHTARGMSGWAGCLEGQNVLTTVRENSPTGELIAELIAEDPEDGIRWGLGGRDADWFFLEGGNLRLNSSPEKVLDSEVHGTVLLADLSCYILKSVYRVLVEILNENEHPPVFAKSTPQSLVVSELIPVNSIVFTVEATDRDGDQIIYSIDQASPDAEYFKVDLPNSGEVVLSKPLDYETKKTISVTVHAEEMNTEDHFSTNTTLTISILDGDDQYPHFLPCTLLFQDDHSSVCTNPVYTVNITDVDEDVILDFSPGPIHAEDGDKGLNTPVSYAILSGGDNGRFLMDRETGEIKLTRRVEDRLTTPTIHLQIIAYQVDDPRKYTVTRVLIRVLAVNDFPPVFDRDQYNGFVYAGNSPAALVNTYGSRILMLRVQDQDFPHGLNPSIYFALNPVSNHSELYQVTQEGLLIAKDNQLKPKQRHVLEVLAVDQESGDTTYALIVVEVLFNGQSIPLSPMGEERLSACMVGKAMVLCFLFMIILGCILYVMSWGMKRHKDHMDPLDRGCVAQGKHPNVSLRWFQLVNHRSPMPQMDEVAFNNEDFGTYNPSFSMQDTPGTYIHKDLPPCRGPAPPSTTAAPDTSFIPADASHSLMFLENNVSTPIKCSSRLPNVNPTVVDVGCADRAQNAAPPEADKDPEDRSENPTSPTTSPSPSPVPPDATSAPPDIPLEQSDISQDAAVVTETPAAPSPHHGGEDPSDVSSSLSPHLPTAPSATFSTASTASPAEVDAASNATDVDTPLPQGEASSVIPSAKRSGTPSPKPGQTTVKVNLVRIDMSSLCAPPASQEDQPSTSSIPEKEEEKGEKEEEGASSSGSESQKSRPLKSTGNTADSHVDGEDNVGACSAGDADAGKKSKGPDDELAPDEEELLRVLARLNPVFMTFNK